MRKKRRRSADYGTGDAAEHYSLADRIGRSVWYRLTAWLPIDMCYSPSTHRVNLVSHCRNLSCTHQVDDAAGSSVLTDEFPDSWLASSLSTLVRRGLCEVIASGFRQKALQNGWLGICGAFPEAPCDVAIIQDFAAPMTADEIAGLVRLESIQVSIETPDAELFSKIHRGQRLETLIANIDSVRACAEAENLPQPKFTFDIVVTNKTIAGLEDLVWLGIQHGVTSFHFSDMYKGNKVKDELHIHNVSVLPWAELRDGLAAMERATRLAKSSRCKVQCDPRLLDGIRSELYKLSNPREPIRVPRRSAHWGAEPVGKGMTRDCSLPWTFLSLCSHGEAYPCLEFRRSVGTLKNETLEEILNGPTLRQIRRNLLTGNLDGERCQRCPMKQQVPVVEFRRRMKGRLVLWSLRRRILNLLQFAKRLRHSREESLELHLSTLSTSGATEGNSAPEN